MTQKNPTPGNNTGLPLDNTDTGAEARIKQWCEWFELDAPQLDYEDGEILLTDSLFAWLDAAGVSLDWLFCGDAKGLAIAYRREHERERPFRKIVSGLDRTEQGFLLEALEANRPGTDSFQKSLGTFKSKVQAHRANL